MNFDGSHTLILAILVLYAGRYLNATVPWLRRNSIPEPVTGGLIASILLTLVQAIAGITFSTIRSVSTSGSTIATPPTTSDRLNSAGRCTIRPWIKPSIMWLAWAIVLCST